MYRTQRQGRRAGRETSIMKAADTWTIVTTGDWVSKPSWDFILNRSQKRVIRLDERVLGKGQWDVTEFWPCGEEGVNGIDLFGPRGENETRVVFDEIKEELCGR